MKARIVVLASLVLTAQVALASHGHGSHATSHHSSSHARSSGTSHHSSRAHPSSHAHSSSHSFGLTAAERRHPRPGTRSHSYHRSHYGYSRCYGCYGSYGPYGPYGFYPFFGFAYSDAYPGYAYSNEPSRPRLPLGELRLSVQPDDAAVYVDGELRGMAREIGSLELAEGPHRVEIVRPGFRSFDREIQLRAHRPVDLDVELDRD